MDCNGDLVDYSLYTFISLYFNAKKQNETFSSSLVGCPKCRDVLLGTQ